MNELRDQIARDAMKELLRFFDFEKFHDDPARLAGWAYDVADAMLIARELEPNKFESYFAQALEKQNKKGGKK